MGEISSLLLWAKSTVRKPFLLLLLLFLIHSTFTLYSIYPMFYILYFIYSCPSLHHIPLNFPTFSKKFCFMHKRESEKIKEVGHVALQLRSLLNYYFSIIKLYYLLFFFLIVYFKTSFLYLFIFQNQKKKKKKKKKKNYFLFLEAFLSQLKLFLLLNVQRRGFLEVFLSFQ